MACILEMCWERWMGGWWCACGAHSRMLVVEPCKLFLRGLMSAREVPWPVRVRTVCVHAACVGCILVKAGADH